MNQRSCQKLSRRRCGVHHVDARSSMPDPDLRLGLASAKIHPVGVLATGRRLLFVQI